MAKGIIITQDNYKQVAGRLRRFFYNEKRYVGRSMTVWHTFSGGMRKRIPVYAFKNTYHDVTMYDNKNEFTIRYGVGNVHRFQIGEEVWFLGNRIIVKSKWDSIHPEDNKKYLYMCYQIAS